MSATVRLFASQGVVVLPVAGNNQLMVTSSRFMLKQRYLARETLAPDTGSPLLSGAPLSASEHVKMLLVQVQPGRRVHYEVFGPNETPVVADTSSPVMDGGDDYIEFYKGWKISLLECSETS